MGFWSDLKEAVGGLTEGATSFIAKNLNAFNNNTFKEAAMAFAAKITMADGVADQSEKMKVAGIIERHEMLKGFDAASLRSLYLKQLEDFEFDFDFASDNIRKKLAAVTDPEQQRGVIMIGIIIGKADGDFDANEQAAVIEVIDMYGHSRAEYGL